MRTSILGVLNYDNLDQVIANTIRIAKVPQGPLGRGT